MPEKTNALLASKTIGAAVSALQGMTSTPILSAQVEILKVAQRKWEGYAGIRARATPTEDAHAALVLAQAIVNESRPTCVVCDLRIRRSLRDSRIWVHADTGIRGGYVSKPHTATEKTA